MPQKYFCWTFISFHEASSKSFHWYCSSDIFLLVTFISHFLGNLLKKLHISNTRLHTTSNFRRLKSCWINWSQVDSSQLVPPSTLLLLFLRGNLTISSAAAPQRKYRFPLWKPGFLSCCTKLCLWRADGDIRRAERSPNIPPDNDPCPTKIAHQNLKMKGRVGGHKQFSSPEELLDQLVPSWLQSTRPPLYSTPSFPPRKSYYFLGGCASEEIQISTVETRISILLHQTLFVTGGWRHPAPPTCCAMQESRKHQTK